MRIVALILENKKIQQNLRTQTWPAACTCSSSAGKRYLIMLESSLSCSEEEKKNGVSQVAFLLSQTSDGNNCAMHSIDVVRRVLSLCIVYAYNWFIY